MARAWVARRATTWTRSARWPRRSTARVSGRSQSPSQAGSRTSSSVTTAAAKAAGVIAAPGRRGPAPSRSTGRRRPRRRSGRYRPGESSEELPSVLHRGLAVQARQGERADAVVESSFWSGIFHAGPRVDVLEVLQLGLDLALGVGDAAT